VQLAPTQ